MRLARGAFLVLLLPLLACSGGDSVTGDSAVRLASADVTIGSVSVVDAVIAPGSGTSTLFSVTLADRARIREVATIRMDYRDHGSMGMMGWSSVPCYDDGTHGDPVAGDGTYCYEDVDGHVGPHRADCPRGEHEYRFHGTDHSGRATNTLACRVRVQ